MPDKPLVIFAYGLWDTGERTLMRLAPYLRPIADVELFDPGWTYLTSIRWQNPVRAKKLAEQIADRPCIIIGHSNGCAVARDCSLFKPAVPIRAMIWLNPALDVVVDVGQQVEAVEVFYTKTDLATGLFARFFGFGHPWGAMGADGYQGDDPRFSSRSMPDVIGHLGIFSRLQSYGPEIRDLVKALWG